MSISEIEKVGLTTGMKKVLAVVKSALQEKVSREGDGSERSKTSTAKMKEKEANDRRRTNKKRVNDGDSTLHNYFSCKKEQK